MTRGPNRVRRDGGCLTRRGPNHGEQSPESTKEHGSD